MLALETQYRFYRSSKNTDANVGAQASAFTNGSIIIFACQISGQNAFTPEDVYPQGWLELEVHYNLFGFIAVALAAAGHITDVPGTQIECLDAADGLFALVGGQH